MTPEGEASSGYKPSAFNLRLLEGCLKVPPTLQFGGF